MRRRRFYGERNGMPWVRIDENAMDHPKIGGLPDGAFRLWVQGLAYCQKYLTDGVISDVAVKGLRAYSPKRRAELVAATLWESAVSGVQVHDYLQWNESRANVMKTREQARERIRRLRGKHQPCNAVTPSEQTENELRSFSGGVSVSSSLASKVKEEGLGETKTLPQRSGEFCEWYSDKHYELFNVGYIGNPQKDYGIAQRLCSQASDAELRDAALVWFGMDDDFARNGTRTLAKFASRATHCIQIARKVSA
jgi:hypothetical protein